MLPDRFWEKVDRSGDCWLWTGSLTRDGYGNLTLRGKVRRAHRVSYEDAKGAIPEGLELDHVCRERRCVRPDHLEPVTHAENMRRSEMASRFGAKTHCPSGHAYDEANTFRCKRGFRQCRACRRISVANYRRKKATGEHIPPQHNDTQCRRGHEYTPENTRLLANGWRACRACQRGRLKAWRDKHEAA